jgi:hypothetical protein
VTPYERALEILAAAEAQYARLKSPAALAYVIVARKVADRLFNDPDRDRMIPAPRPTIGNRAP